MFYIPDLRGNVVKDVNNETDGEEAEYESNLFYLFIYLFISYT